MPARTKKSPPPEKVAPRRAPARAVSSILSYARAAAGPRSVRPQLNQIRRCVAGYLSSVKISTSSNQKKKRVAVSSSAAGQRGSNKKKKGSSPPQRMKLSSVQRRRRRFIQNLFPCQRPMAQLLGRPPHTIVTQRCRPTSKPLVTPYAEEIRSGTAVKDLRAEDIGMSIRHVQRADRSPRLTMKTIITFRAFLVL
ncbi:hypothetical protein EVAR_98657_1 [Eumeta japonica]|uniref:Uncharacterized protein n=1 Tax=Eumeta variegata TaxID=151549 RepID=A0A4C1XWX8_EUMVA|nr:hypothetical protein EVAR_98657_1 [Eumeta japonica]